MKNSVNDPLLRHACKKLCEGLYIINTTEESLICNFCLESIPPLTEEKCVMKCETCCGTGIFKDALVCFRCNGTGILTEEVNG